ncbi:MAG: tRNA pseudouridine(38-40) synthase TruA [Beijerinckiaceae bacterium]
MFRHKLTIEYDGTPFVGWQRQANGLSVQQAIETAIEGVSGERRIVQGAGRTDAGVHARGQVAHVDLSRQWRGDKLRDAINAHLKPAPIAILAAESVASDFEARFSARARHYTYRILNRRGPPTLERDFVWHVARRLDAEAMHAAAQCLVGRHDFSTFRAAECQANGPVRTLDRLDVVRTGETIEIFASARSFLHHQVRSMVGSLEHVGSGKWTGSDIAEARDARDRARCGMVAPARGLFLMRVDYGAG